MRSILPALVLGSWLSATALAKLVVHDGSFTPDQVLRVTIGQIDSGCQTHQDIVVNGTSPGPVLHILPGATTWVRVYNDMDDQNLTMHWHGITQRLAPFADGTPMASQWPIPPGHFFDYEIVTDKDDAGTYYYHSHVEMQAMTCIGALVVDDCGQAPFQYDDERILMFGDWFDSSSHSMASQAGGAPFQGPPETGGLLLNGHGVPGGKTAVAGKDHTRGKHSAPGQRRQTEDSQCELPVIDVDAGKTYRFRFIGGTSLSLVAAAFEGHGNMTVIQVDGSEYSQPVSTDHMQVGVGQRFDVLFKTKTAEELQADGNRMTYYVQMQTLDSPRSFVGYAVLRYSQDAKIPAVPANPVVDIPTGEATWNWMEYTLQPLQPDQSDFPSADEVTRRVTIDVGLVSLPNGKIEYQFNKLSWFESTYTSPLLVDIYLRGEAAVPNYEAAIKNGGWDPNTLAWPAKIGEVLEIIWQNTGAEADRFQGMVESHPFHAHSKHFYDLGGGPGAYDADANNAKISQLGYKPIRRDTTLLYSYGQRTGAGQVASWRGWRLRITDAGVWMVHCHILTHMMIGMQSVWVVGNATQIEQVPMAESQGYLTYGGDVYGNENYNPTYYEWTNEAAKQCQPI
ncbi:putative L-ascorbate oxidase [Rhypophila decipiens]|uniref:L-ascorbate oxidase n=1 Tax=Rhypophila decipiens TaxID=261697 RepID=A0AAN6Y4E3_9PEZI|nr:putative L-ascorbate oxidase [Rhypophila decipiens]